MEGVCANDKNLMIVTKRQHQEHVELLGKSAETINKIFK
jgi:hypothetical protein